MSRDTSSRSPSGCRSSSASPCSSWADDRAPAPARWTALAGSVLGLLVCIPLWTGFQPIADMQFTEMTPWIARFNVSYHLGVDGISMPLILLNSLMTVLVVIAHWEVVKDKVGQYLAAFLIMSGLINGVFAALDAVLFYVVLRGDADPDVPHHRDVGRAQPRLRGGEVLPLHAARLALDARGVHLPLQPDQRQLGDPRLPEGAPRLLGADPRLHRDADVLRREGADVARAHVAAGRARGGAHGRLGDPRRDHAEDRRLRLPALQHARSRPTPRTTWRAS